MRSSCLRAGDSPAPVLFLKLGRTRRPPASQGTHGDGGTSKEFEFISEMASSGFGSRHTSTRWNNPPGWPSALPSRNSWLSPSTDRSRMSSRNNRLGGAALDKVNVAVNVDVS